MGRQRLPRSRCGSINAAAASEASLTMRLVRLVVPIARHDCA